MKDKLTQDQVLENKMTWLDAIRYYKPEATEEQADYILWNETSYPFDDNKNVLDQIYSFFKISDDLKNAKIK